MKINLNKYQKRFQKTRFWKKWGEYLQRFGQKSLYTILLLYYAYERPETPFWAKSMVMGMLGYLLTPIDAIPDLTPILGYTDDFGILSFGLVTIACYIDKNVRKTAREKLNTWFADLDEKALEEVDIKV